MSVLNATSAVLKGVMRLPRKVFGSRNDRLLKTYERQIEPITRMEADLRREFDQRYSQRLVEDHVDDLPEEERPEARQHIRVELSNDLRERKERLQERITLLCETLDQWWRSLEPSQRVQQYFHQEYRKRNLKLIDTLDREGISAEAFAILREASRRAQAHRHFDCQLIGGRVLFAGNTAELRAGEG